LTKKWKLRLESEKKPKNWLHNKETWKYRDFLLLTIAIILLFYLALVGIMGEESPNCSNSNKNPESNAENSNIKINEWVSNTTKENRIKSTKQTLYPKELTAQSILTTSDTIVTKSKTLEGHPCLSLHLLMTISTFETVPTHCEELVGFPVSSSL